MQWPGFAGRIAAPGPDGNFEATEDVVAALRPVRPNVTILVRRHDAEQCRTLQKLGASLVVSENLEASLELAREALLRDHSDANEAESLILRFRDEHYSRAEDDDTDQLRP